MEGGEPRRSSRSLPARTATLSSTCWPFTKRVSLMPMRPSTMTLADRKVAGHEPTGPEPTCAVSIESDHDRAFEAQFCV